MAESIDTLRVTLSYPLDRVKEPILYHLVTDFDLVPDIRRANIDIHSGGSIEMDLGGSAEDIRRGLSWLENVGVSVQSVVEEDDTTWSQAVLPPNA
jgi:hypothetical protein